ncbi:hypothetical protein TNCV_2004701 [Trichonephila clavipes]|nr:hypothetical protein TNCV_2004701 [Trichonephila clavipes]
MAPHLNRVISTWAGMLALRSSPPPRSPTLVHSLARETLHKAVTINVYALKLAFLIKYSTIRNNTPKHLFRREFYSLLQKEFRTPRAISIFEQVKVKCVIQNAKLNAHN